MKTPFLILLASIFFRSCSSVVVTLEGGARGTLNVEGNQGAAKLLSCSASASSTGGSTDLQWTYSATQNGPTNLVYYDGQIRAAYSERISFVNPMSINIRDLISSDSGFYVCRVTMPDDSPSVDTGTYNLTVLVAPNEQISCGFPSDLKITLGQRATFQCSETVAVAVPSPTYTWYKNGIPLPVTSTGNPQYANSSFSYSPTTGTLTFSSVTQGDSGTYYCEASNKVGKSQCNAAAITTKEQNVGLIVGIVFAVIFGLLLIGVLIWWTWRKGYCEGLFDCFEGKEVDDDAPDDGANDIMLDSAGPVVTKEPSEWSNGTSNKQEASMMI